MPCNPSRRAHQMSVVTPNPRGLSGTPRSARFHAFSPCIFCVRIIFLDTRPLFWQSRGQRKRGNGSGLRSNLHRGQQRAPVRFQQER
jgi:hypothetical protein